MATYYVRGDADGLGDGTTTGTSGATGAWTFSQFVTAFKSGAGAAGDTVWVCAIGGTIARTTAVDDITKDGTAVLPITIRGCYETANDLDTPTYNVDGTLDTTRYPSITYTTGRWSGSGADFVHLRAIKFSGAPTNYLVYMGNNCVITQCSVTQTGNHGSAVCLYTGTIGDVVNCDFIGNSGTLGSLVETSGATITANRFKTVSSRAINCSASGAVLVGNTFFAPVGTSAVAIDHSSTNTGHELNIVAYNTIVGGWDIGIKAANAANDRIMHIVNNHITGCLTAGIKTLYTTSMRAALIVGNRLRDNGTGGNVVGYDNWYAACSGLNTTATGSDSADFIDASSNNYRLKPSSPSASAGIGGVGVGSRGAAGGASGLRGRS